MFKPVESLVVPVVDAFTGLQLSHPLPNSKGERVYKERTYGVSPLRTLWPEVSVVILDWNKAFEALEDQLNEDIKKAKRENQEVPDFREDQESPARSISAISSAHRARVGSDVDSRSNTAAFARSSDSTASRLAFGASRKRASAATR